MADLAGTQAEQLMPLLIKLTEQLQRSEAERSQLAEKVASLERRQQAQGDNLVRRIQTAIAQGDRHADRLQQRLEQVSAEETRLAAQLQRIEGVVEETRALQSRALAVIPQAMTVAPPPASRAGTTAALLILLAGLAAAGGLLWTRLPALPVAWPRLFAIQPLPAAAPADPLAQFLAREKAATPPLSRIRPDAGLPAGTRPLEAKALAGDAPAEHDLAALYTGGHAGIPADDAKAALWFREAAIRGVANARYNLGVLYQQGLGVKKDLNEAIGWYQAAAALGHPEASYNLGIASIEGIGLPYNPAAAAQDFRMAARAGLPSASYNLGLMYETGLLGGQNLPQALYWYGRATALGNEQAGSALVRLAQAAHLSPDDVGRQISGLNPDMPPLQVQPAQMPAKTLAAPLKPASPPRPSIPPSDAAAGELLPDDKAVTP